MRPAVETRLGARYLLRRSVLMRCFVSVAWFLRRSWPPSDTGGNVAVIPANSSGSVTSSAWQIVASVSSDGLMCPPSILEIRERSTSASNARSVWVLPAAVRRRLRLLPSASVTSFGREPVEGSLTNCFSEHQYTWHQRFQKCASKGNVLNDTMAQSCVSYRAHTPKASAGARCRGCRRQMCL